MNFSNVAINLAKHADDCLGKTFNGINKKINITKIPQKLAQELSQNGVNVRRKYTKREVLAAMNHAMQSKIDNTAKMSVKILSADPSPDMLDLIDEAGEVISKSCLINNTGLAKTADNARTILSARYENLPESAQSAINKFMSNPANIIKAYTG